MSTTTLHNQRRLGTFTKELIIQILIALLLVVAFSSGREHFELRWSRLVFMANHLAAALVINYLLLPRFFYQRKYWMFGILVLIVIVGAVCIEELVLEKIFFPDTRGARFTNVFFNVIRMLPMIMIFVGFKFAWDAQVKNKEILSLKSAVADGQLQFLKSQINPHFLFNSLNNLYSYALEKSEKTPDIILGLSSLLRYMLYDCRAEKVPLDKEVKYLEDFVKLQSLQIEDRGDVQFTTEGIFSGKMVAPLIMVVFIENCFKHSTSSQSDQILIDMNVKMNDPYLELECINSYSSKENTQSLTKGIGLENVLTRLDLLYPGKYTLNIQPDVDLYKVNLKIDLS